MVIVLTYISVSAIINPVLSRCDCWNTLRKGVLVTARHVSSSLAIGSDSGET